MNEIKIFNLEIKGITFAEWSVRPSIGTVLKTALIGGIALGAGVGAMYVVDFIDDSLRPQYVVSRDFAPEPPPLNPEWQRPTNWNIHYENGGRK